MKFEDVQKIHTNLDCENSWSDEDHLAIQAFCRLEDELLVVRFGGFRNQTYLYRLPADHEVPGRGDSLYEETEAIPVYDYEDGVLWAGEDYYDAPDQPEPYDPNSGEAGVLDVDMSGDWQITDIKYLCCIAEESASRARCHALCYEDALDALRKCQE